MGREPYAFAEVVWQQLGAAADTLANAIRACPDELWDDGSKPPDLIWYGAYHATFFLDCYTSEVEEGFAPPAPFTLSEYDPDGAMPPRTYTKEEVLGYLDFARRKAQARVRSLGEEDVVRSCGFARRKMSVVELMIYVTRHVQHHAAQINLLLRQRAGIGSAWVSRAVATPART